MGTGIEPAGPQLSGTVGDRRPLVVVTAISLRRAAREALAERLGPGHVVRDIRDAGNEADVVLVPSVSGQLIGSMRAMFPGAKILLSELVDDEFGLGFAGPVTRALASGADGYVAVTDLGSLATATRDLAHGRSAGALTVGAEEGRRPALAGGPGGSGSAGDNGGTLGAVELRPAGSADVEFLARVVFEANQDRYAAREDDWDTADTRRGLVEDAAEQVAGQVPDSLTSVIEVDGRPVGRLRVVRTARGFEIAGLQVLPDRQRQGIGTAVVHRVQDEARVAGLPVELEVEPDNPDAARLYRRLGFEPVGTGVDGSLRLRCRPLLDRTAFLASLPRRRLATGAVIRDPDGRVCLVEPTYKSHWILPGGTVETGESPARACRRELVEELGVERPVGRLLGLTTIEPDPPVDPHGALMLDYDAGVVGPEEIARFRLPAAELSDVAFVAPDKLEGYLTDRMRARVLAALEALRTGAVVER